MNRFFNIFFSSLFLVSLTLFVSCADDEPKMILPQETDFTDLLSNQVNNVIIPCMIDYENKMNGLLTASNEFASTINEANLTALRTAYREAYISYQRVAVHNYFATANMDLIKTSNLYPIDTMLLNSFIANRSYNFNTLSQERANGFPAIDFLLYGSNNAIASFAADSNRIDFLKELVNSMRLKSRMLAEQWQGNLKNNFINNGGVALGSSISTQLNETIFYYEDHIRENKVGIPIGRIGPNDSPIDPDPTKIEAYYQSMLNGNEDFTFELLKTAVKEMEYIYLGMSADKVNGQGYDDLLVAREQASIDTDIKAAFQAIYTRINARNSISGDETLYLEIQTLVTLYKSDLLPVLNVQDADGINDGD